MGKIEQFTSDQVRNAQQFDHLLKLYKKTFTDDIPGEQFAITDIDEDKGMLVEHRFYAEDFLRGFHNIIYSRYKDLSIDESIFPAEVDFTDPLHPVLLHDLTEPIVKLRVKKPNELGKEIAEDVLEQNRGTFRKTA